jgi:hypothetical protein
VLVWEERVKHELADLEKQAVLPDIPRKLNASKRSAVQSHVRDCRQTSMKEQELMPEARFQTFGGGQELQRRPQDPIVENVGQKLIVSASELPVSEGLPLHDLI